MNKQSRTLGSIVLTGLLVAGMLVASCRRDNAEPAKPNNPGAGDEEVITTVELHFTNQADTTQHFHAKWEDLDGDGPNAPVVDSIVLKPSTTYDVKIELVDKTKTPAHDVTHHIEEEANYHRFHYTFTQAVGSGASLTTSITDLDGLTPPQPVGLKFTVSTGANLGRGTYNVNLRHFANNATKTANITDGEADVNVDFKTVVKP